MRLTYHEAIAEPVGAIIAPCKSSEIPTACAVFRMKLSYTKTSALVGGVSMQGKMQAAKHTAHSDFGGL